MSLQPTPPVAWSDQAADALSNAQVIQAEGTIYMVLEYGDIDLARLLAKHEKAHREGGSDELDENFIRLYWQQMLQVSTGLSLQCLVADCSWTESTVCFTCLAVLGPDVEPQRKL